MIVSKLKTSEAKIQRISKSRTSKAKGSERSTPETSKSRGLNTPESKALGSKNMRKSTHMFKNQPRPKPFSKGLNVPKPYARPITQRKNKTFRTNHKGPIKI
jgi:hypothetical protein